MRRSIAPGAGGEHASTLIVSRQPRGLVDLGEDGIDRTRQAEGVAGVIAPAQPQERHPAVELQQGDGQGPHLFAARCPVESIGPGQDPIGDRAELIVR